MIFALGSLPAKPNRPMKIVEESSSNSIMVTWEENIGDSLAVIGYRLYADTGLKDQLKIVFDGKNKAALRKFLFTSVSTKEASLSPLLFYRFQVSALNFNGESERSDISILQTCTAPSNIPMPSITKVSTTLV